MADEPVDVPTIHTVEAKNDEENPGMAEIQNNSLLSTVDALQALAAQRMSVRVALRVRRTLHAFADAAEPVNEVRKGLIEEHGSDGQITPQDMGWKAFVGDVNELMEQVTEVEVPEVVTLEDIGDAELTPAQVDALVQAGVLALDE